MGKETSIRIAKRQELTLVRVQFLAHINKWPKSKELSVPGGFAARAKCLF